MILEARILASTPDWCFTDCLDAFIPSPPIWVVFIFIAIPVSGGSQKQIVRPKIILQVDVQWLEALF